MKLNISTGHNSSAVLTKGSTVIAAYEEERLSKVKADSSFPKLAIEQLIRIEPDCIMRVKEINIGNWYWSKESFMSSKHLDYKYLRVRFPRANINLTGFDNNKSHHDTHAKSVHNFSRTEQGLTVVMDGFGNFGETISIYNNGMLESRSYNINTSLGMMYQYATEYLNLKPHLDEYKLLGYEQMFFNLNANDVKTHVEKSLQTFMRQYELKNSLQLEPSNVSYIEFIEELRCVKHYWFTAFDIMLDSIDDNYLTMENKRAIIAYFVQSILETSVLKLIKDNIKDHTILQLSGGIFYNVKLNNAILNNFEGIVHICPVAGDQGTVLGYDNLKLSNLFLGLRDDSAIYYKTSDIIIDQIEKLGYCNVFQGPMEFGPRALGNTSTLMLPTLENVERMNTLNGRNTVMPMAPIVTEEYARYNFANLDKIPMSKYFMTVALDFIGTPKEASRIRGALHSDTRRKTLTGRIQVCKSLSLNYVLEYFGGVLINTSYNAHGQPILYDYNDQYICSKIQKTNVL